MTPIDIQVSRSKVSVEEYMTPIDIQVSRSKVSVEGQAFSIYVGEGGTSVLKTAIFYSKGGATF